MSSESEYNNSSDMRFLEDHFAEHYSAEDVDNELRAILASVAFNDIQDNGTNSNNRNHFDSEEGCSDEDETIERNEHNGNEHAVDVIGDVGSEDLQIDDLAIHFAPAGSAGEVDTEEDQDENEIYEYGIEPTSDSLELNELDTDDVDVDDDNEEQTSDDIAVGYNLDIDTYANVEQEGAGDGDDDENNIEGGDEAGSVEQAISETDHIGIDHIEPTLSNSSFMLSQNSHTDASRTSILERSVTSQPESTEINPISHSEQINSSESEASKMDKLFTKKFDKLMDLVDTLDDQLEFCDFMQPRVPICDPTDEVSRELTLLQQEIYPSLRKRFSLTIANLKIAYKNQPQIVMKIIKDGIMKFHNQHEFIIRNRRKMRQRYARYYNSLYSSDADRTNKQILKETLEEFRSIEEYIYSMQYQLKYKKFRLELYPMRLLEVNELATRIAKFNNKSRILSSVSNEFGQKYFLELRDEINDNLAELLNDLVLKKMECESEELKERERICGRLVEIEIVEAPRPIEPPQSTILTLTQPNPNRKYWVFQRTPEEELESRNNFSKFCRSVDEYFRNKNEEISSLSSNGSASRSDY